MTNTALNAANLANNLASATRGLATALGLANPDPKFPEFPGQAITSDFQREHWYKNPSQGLYSLSVEPVGTGSISEFPAFVQNITSLFTDFFNDSAGNFGEFKLPITPQEITQTEDFAVSIKPTQGGTVVNHSGNKYKTLNISGTTGVQPNRGLLGVLQASGNALGKPDDLKYRSGYEVFQHFRMYLKAYHEAKSKAGKTELRMLWRNYKDWEFLYVEPIKFVMKRDANRPLLYNYNIQFKVIGVHTINKPIFEQIISRLNQVASALVNAHVLVETNRSVSEYFTGLQTDFRESLTSLRLALAAANRQPLTLAEFSPLGAQRLSYRETMQLLGVFGRSLEDAARAPIISPWGVSFFPNNPEAEAVGQELQAQAEAVDQNNIPAELVENSESAQEELANQLAAEPGIAATIAATAALPEHAVATLVAQQTAAALISPVTVAAIQAQARALSDNLAQAVGLSDETYNEIFDLSETTVPLAQNEVTDAQFETLYALSQVESSIDSILSSDAMFDTNAAIYSQAGSTNGANSVGAGIFNVPNPNAGTVEGPLPAGVTLEDIALRELGDASRWTEIAELNGLKAPYISSLADTFFINLEIISANYSNPTQIEGLLIGDFFLISDNPAPGGAWVGRENWLAEYLGGDETASQNWRFVFPDDGMVVQSVLTREIYKFSDATWTLLDAIEAQQDGVLKPGDKIKIPSRAASPITTPIQGRRDNPLTNALSNAEKSLSVDLALTADLDLELLPSGDLNVVSGIQNGAQAIVLKLLYEKGTLKKYPKIGTNLTPGKKMPDIATMRADLTTSLLQDSRIRKVSKINLIQENSGVNLSFEVTFNDIQQPVPISIPL